MGRLASVAAMTDRAWPRRVAAVMRLLPLAAISRLAGRLARVRLPAPLQRAQIRLFGRVFGVDLGEARDPVESYACFQDFFTRALRAGARPVDAAADAFVSPCDGAWGASGRIESGTLLQVKGRAYPLAALLGSADEAKRLEGGSFATFYLSPRDYHRFHAPCDTRVVAARYLPGTLWPVNRIGLEGVDGLFAHNERICAWMHVEGVPAPSDEPPLCLVAVGATMVGAVRVVFDSLSTNIRGGAPTLRLYPEPIRLARGQEWGRFEFGSTIVMVAAAGTVALESEAPGTPMRLGRRIGTVPARS